MKKSDPDRALRISTWRTILAAGRTSRRYQALKESIAKMGEHLSADELLADLQEVSAGQSDDVEDIILDVLDHLSGWGREV